MSISPSQYQPCNEEGDHFPWGKGLQVTPEGPTARAVSLAFPLRGGNVGNGTKIELPRDLNQRHHTGICAKAVSVVFNPPAPPLITAWLLCIFGFMLVKSSCRISWSAWYVYFWNYFYGKIIKATHQPTYDLPTGLALVRGITNKNLNIFLK